MSFTDAERQRILEQLEKINPSSFTEQSFIAKEGLDDLETLLTEDLNELRIINEEFQDIWQKAYDGSLSKDDLSEIDDLLEHEEKFKRGIKKLKEFSNSDEGQALKDLLNSTDKINNKVDNMETAFSNLRQKVNDHGN